MVREGVVVIDVGMNRLPTGKVTGDVDFASVAPGPAPSRRCPAASVP